MHYLDCCDLRYSVPDCTRRNLYVENPKYNNTTLYGLGDIAWMAGVVAALPLGLYGPKAFSEGGSPSNGNIILAWKR